MMKQNDEGIRYIPIHAIGKTYRVWTKKVGSHPTVKVLLLHGGPGGNSMIDTIFDDYFPNRGYEFYYYDQLGSTNSDQPSDVQLWNIPRFVDEVEQVRVALGLTSENFYLYGNSWGGLLAMEYALKYQEHIRGLIVSGMQANSEDYNRYASEILAPQLGEEWLGKIRELEALNDYSNPLYHELLAPYYRNFLLRMDQKDIPPRLTQALTSLNKDIYMHMNGPSEFGIKGTLKDWDIRDRLKNIHVPTLFMGSTFNTMDPEQMRWMAGQVQDGMYHHCDKGSHCSMWDDSESYFSGIFDFIHSVEQKCRNREIIEDILHIKKQAIKNHDLDLYLSTISSSDKHYLKEQENWFKAMEDENFHKLKLDIVKVMDLGNQRLKAIIRQRHRYFDDFDFTYPLIFKMENGYYRDSGYDFNVIDTPKYIIRYMPGDDRVEKLIEIIDLAFERIENIFHKKLDEKAEFKLFSNNEILRQRTLPNIKWLYYGWSDPGESIKLYTGLENMDSYHGLIQYELVHLLTLSISHGHTSKWLSEGLAVTYGNADYNIEDDILFHHKDQFNLHKTLAEIEEFDLRTQTDMDKIAEWYVTCGSYVNYLLDQFGHEKVMDIFKECDRLSPLYDLTDQHASIDITKEAIINILNESQEDISQEYLKIN